MVLAEVDGHDPDRAVPSGWWQEDPAKAGDDREIGAERSDLEEGPAEASDDREIGAERSASMFPKRCEILDFWHAVEHAWQFARLCYGEESKLAARWVHRLAKDLRAGKVHKVIRRLKAMRPASPEAREELF